MRAVLGLHLLSLAFWAFLVLSSVALFPLALAIWAVTAPFDRRLVVLHRFTCFWGSLYTWLNPAWPVTVEGREQVADGVAYVMTSNHQSLVDILVLFRLFRHFKWVSKIENFRVPLIGWNMRLNRYIPLVRGQRESVVAMMAMCEQTLAQGSSVMIFPEGTRSADGRLKAFKTGAFELALRTKAPILPIALDGTARALPKRGYLLQGRHPIRVRLLAPLDPATYGSETPESLAERVRQIIARELPPEHQPA
ncbi:MAG TPA: lysophospholipid acyltransferase family protein [Myxococcota bacterium]|nr:lysophospholipid acyltransferase family protein [Myxococcota bacterium]